MNVPFSYLQDQFAEPDAIFSDIRKLIERGDYTLGSAVSEFEAQFAQITGARYAVGVNSGTDALMLALKALEIGMGHEVITVSHTFIATVGAIAMSGARPVFVDVDEQYSIDPDLIEAAITERTRAILPVYWGGHPPDMPRILEIAAKHNLHVIEDSCQGIGAAIDGKPAGSWGIAAGFSLHPLKNINVWGDSGIAVTSSEELARKLRLLRNHGLSGRDEVEIFGHNSRLDTLQAIVGLHIIKQLGWINETRIKHARAYDTGLADLAPQITLRPSPPNFRNVYHLYMIQAQDRDGLLADLNSKGIEAKVHYPIPVHMQPASRQYGYKEGDFPVTERQCKSTITLPAHQHLSQAQIDYTIEAVRSFYGK